MKVLIGVDPHKASLAVAAIDEATGELLERASFSQDRSGLRSLERWAKRFPERHRTVLGGILWVVRTGSSWREMPEEFGKWERAYRRHELWAKQGLWQPILRALGEEDLSGPATKEPK